MLSTKICLFSLIRTWLFIKLQGQILNEHVPACWRSKHVLGLSGLFSSWSSNSYTRAPLIVLMKLFISLKWWVCTTLADLVPQDMCLRMGRRDLLSSLPIPRAGQNSEQIVGARSSRVLSLQAAGLTGFSTLLAKGFWTRAAGHQSAQGTGNSVTVATTVEHSCQFPRTDTLLC